MTGEIFILIAFLLGHAAGVTTFWLALRILGRVKYDLDNDLPVLQKDEVPTEQDYTG